jgi:hypothetical protein
MLCEVATRIGTSKRRIKDPSSGVRTLNAPLRYLSRIVIYITMCQASWATIVAEMVKFLLAAGNTFGLCSPMAYQKQSNACNNSNA